MNTETLVDELERLGPWYHRIEFGNGVHSTPGNRDQSIVFELYREYLPEDLNGLTVLDLGANAAGLSIEFARRGASVTAVEAKPNYCQQARFVADHFGLSDSIDIVQANIYSLASWSEVFDIVCHLGLSYHLRYPQLALDLISNLCKGQLLASSQTIEEEGLVMRNRAERVPEEAKLRGWEPTEEVFTRMLLSSGFRNPRLVSRAPHTGETKHRRCGNRSYFIADAAPNPVKLPW